MLSDEHRQEIKDRVANGVAFLDEHEPGWFRDINLEQLALEDCERCILGQLGEVRHREALQSQGYKISGYSWYLGMAEDDPTLLDMFNYPGIYGFSTLSSAAEYDHYTGFHHSDYDQEVGGYEAAWAALDQEWTDVIKRKFEQDTV